VNHGEHPGGLAQEHALRSNGCIEVAFVGGQVAIRHSKDPSGPVLIFSPTEWEAFLAGVRCGEFDLR
jgi:hypothetical protein